MKIFRVIRIASALALVQTLATSCSEPAAPKANVDPCSGPIQIRVNTTGAKPVFSWTPSCGISFFQVRVSDKSESQLTADDILWGFSTSRQSSPGGPVAVPGVVYGQAPDGAFIWPAKSLKMGTTYKVVGEYWLGGDLITASGSTTFTWPYGPD